MFRKTDLEYLRQQPYDIIQINYHDVTICSFLTDHEWVVVSNYETPECYILHRHSGRYPFHHQRGRYKSLEKAIDYINKHETWFVSVHERERTF